MWIQIIPACIVAILVILIPGFLIGSAARLPLMLRIGWSPVLSVLAITSSTLLSWLTHTRWNLAWVGAMTVALMAIVFAVSTLLRRSRWVHLTLQVRPTTESPKKVLICWAQYLIGIVVAAIVFVPRYLGVFRTPDNFLQRYDNAFHLNAIAWIIRTGQAASPQLGWMVNSDIYPLGWHHLNALTSELSQVSITGTVCAVMFVTMLVIWPMGLASLLETVYHPSIWARVVLPPLSLAFISFPHVTIQTGGIYSNYFGFALAPAILAALLETSQIARRARLSTPSAIGITVLLGIGGVCAHPNCPMLMAAVSLPALWISIYRVWKPADECAEAKARVNRWLWTVLVVAATGLLGVAWIVLAPSLEIAPWSGFESIPQATGEFLWGASMGMPTVWVAGFSAIFGLYVVLMRKRQYAWFLLCHLVVFSFYLVSVAFSNGTLRNLITGLFYNDSRRTASAISLTTTIMAAIGVEYLMIKLLTSARRTHLKTWLRWLVASILSLVLGLATYVGSGLDVQMNALRFAFAYNAQGYNELVSYPERILFDDIAKMDLGDAVIANNPLDGSGLLYALNNNAVLTYYMLQRDDPDREYINANLNRLTTNPRVCPLLEKYNVRYVVTLNPRLVGDAEYVREGYMGLRIRTHTPGFELVKRRGESALWKITGCDG